MKVNILLFSIFLILLGCGNSTSKINFELKEQPIEGTAYPKEKWLSTPPQNFGYSEEKLNNVRNYFEDIGGEACMVIKNGYVIASWGDVSTPIDSRSMRKSFLNALLGIEFGNDNLQLNNTLEDLDIDDKEPLSESEKKATVENLLTSSSGVFHKANYESSEQKGARPPRGSFKNGSFFYYGNWDFNTLGHIYSRLSGEDIFTSFNKNIAVPLEMEDFSLENCRYEYGKESNFPAYLFKTSARDDARFGLLYLNEGKWNDDQIIPKDWILRSTTGHVNTSKFYYYDYGYLWWVNSKNHHYFARGNSGQYIAVMPKENMVIVFRASPGSIIKKWLGNRVKPQESFQLIDKVLAAKEVAGS